MKTLVTYMSQTGNTKKIAEAIYETISGEKEIKQLKEIDSLEDYDFALRASELLDDSEIVRNPIVLYNHRVHNNSKTNHKDIRIKSAARSIRESLRRKEGIEARVEFESERSLGDNGIYTCFKYIPFL